MIHTSIPIPTLSITEHAKSTPKQFIYLLAHKNEPSGLLINTHLLKLAKLLQQDTTKRITSPPLPTLYTTIATSKCVKIKFSEGGRTAITNNLLHHQLY